MGFQINSGVPWLCFIFIIWTCAVSHCYAQTSTLTVDASNSSGRTMPKTLFGIFYEEINHAGAGGLWAELVNNRGFEAGGTIVPSNIAPWTIIGQESSTILVQTELSSCFENNKVALRMDILCDNCPSGVGVSNPGYWGMNIEQGVKYNIVFFVRSTGPIDLTLAFKDTKTRATLASGHVIGNKAEVANWKRMEITLSALASSTVGSLFITTTKKGTIWLDQVSAMPNNTYNGHGCRADLVKMIADLKPAFLRFPGGCFVEGQTLRNAFRWKDSVGPWEERPGHFNDIWSYWTDEGFGFYEGLVLAEDLGTEPLWVFNNGISHTDEIESSVIQPFVQEALDGIEFARGPATSKFGSMRASMGHPKPFSLKYVAVGNEDCSKTNYKANYIAFYNAIKRAYPDILIVSNCDASSKPLDHPADLFDYHTYPTNAQNMFNNYHAFDNTSRTGPKAFVSEYALIGGHQEDQAKLGTILGAVSEAGFLIGLEKNSDIVAMACYAPLFANANDRMWSPDAINFNSNQSYGTPSYWVTYLFRESNGATYLKSQLQDADSNSVVASAILYQNAQNKTALKIKVANIGSSQLNLNISISGYTPSGSNGSMTVLTSGNAMDMNDFSNPTKISPQQSAFQSSNLNSVKIAPISLTILDL